MRAVVHDRYGPPEVLRIEEVERPVPEDDEVLVRIHATTVNRTDCGIRAAEPIIVRCSPACAGRSSGSWAASSREKSKPSARTSREFAVGDEVFGIKGFGATRGVHLRARDGRIAHSRPA